MKKVTITIKQKNKSYDIIIGDETIEQINNYVQFSDYTKVVLITDKNIWRWWRNAIIDVMPPQSVHIILPPSEQAKNIQSIQTIWEKLQSFGCDRKSLVINIGGGVICDIGGFAAATYMRGIDCINIPTTLLSQIDASVGGKTGFDFAGIKNLIGTFTQPKAVLIDVKTLKTLPKREFLSGFAEIIKHGLVSDKKYFEKVTSKKPHAFTDDELIDIIKKSCEIKSEIVMHDEKESGQRKLLNFGHTVGHAIESLSLETNHPLLHGEAISIGMATEALIAQQIGLLSQHIIDIIKTKLDAAGLPISIPLQYQRNAIIQKMQSDKKNERSEIRFTLLKQIGEGVINQTVPEEILIKVLK